MAAWLQSVGIDAVEPVAGVPQPTRTAVTDRPVTWWHELGPHRSATPAELGRVLASVHRLQVPVEPTLPKLNPFAKLATRVQDASVISQQDRDWLLTHLEQMQQRWSDLPAGLGGRCGGVVHGDAWQDNVAAGDHGRLWLLDLEHVAIGPVEWDLAVIAVDHTDFDRIDDSAYRSFVDAYGGYDVTGWPGYRTLADLWELRWVGFALARSRESREAAAEAIHRIACLRGDRTRPWTWNPL